MELLEPGCELPQMRIPEAVMDAAPPVTSNASALQDLSARPQGTLTVTLPCRLKAFAALGFNDSMQSPLEVLSRVTDRATTVGLADMKMPENPSGTGWLTTASTAV